MEENGLAPHPQKRKLGPPNTEGKLNYASSLVHQSQNLPLFWGTV